LGLHKPKVNVASPDASRKHAPLITWWTRNFRGSKDQVAEVRHWIEELLPPCAARSDLLLLTSELCTNAIVHSRSGEAGGQISVDIEWAPALARVTVGDQGSVTGPVVAAAETDPPQLCEHECGRGLLLVNEVAEDWGTVSRPNRRWVWADVPWQARGGVPLDAPDDQDTVLAGGGVIRRAFPGSSIWWGHRTKAWWAAVPGATDVHSLINSPTRDGLIWSLARAYPAA
jgi:anti-sigma regulatory factor (Ser/Thr protein kinase)